MAALNVTERRDTAVATLIKSLVRTDSPDTIATYLFISHTVFSLVPAILVWRRPNAGELFWLAMLGLFATVIFAASIYTTRINTRRPSGG